MYTSPEYNINRRLKQATIPVLAMGALAFGWYFSRDNQPGINKPGATVSLPERTEPFHDTQDSLSTAIKELYARGQMPFSTDSTGESSLYFPIAESIINHALPTPVEATFERLSANKNSTRVQQRLIDALKGNALLFSAAKRIAEQRDKDIPNSDLNAEVQQTYYQPTFNAILIMHRCVEGFEAVMVILKRDLESIKSKQHVQPADTTQQQELNRRVAQKILAVQQIETTLLAMKKYFNEFIAKSNFKNTYQRLTMEYTDYGSTGAYVEDVVNFAIDHFKPEETVDPLLFIALIWHESGFDAKTQTKIAIEGVPVSTATGLTQTINETFFNWLKQTHPDSSLMERLHKEARNQGFFTYNPKDPVERARHNEEQQRYFAFLKKNKLPTPLQPHWNMKAAEFYLKKGEGRGHWEDSWNAATTTQRKLRAWLSGTLTATDETSIKDLLKILQQYKTRLQQTYGTSTDRASAQAQVAPPPHGHAKNFAHTKPLRHQNHSDRIGAGFNNATRARRNV